MIRFGLIAVLLLATACGTSGPQGGGGSDGGTLHVWVLEDKLNETQQKAADEFNKTSPVKVVIDKFNPDSYPDKLRVSIGSPNAPDVFFNWGSGSIAPYVKAGELADLTPAFDADPALKSAFLPAVLDVGKIDGKYYGVPLRGMQPVILFYNKDVFGDAQPPKTWQDLLSLVDTFKAKGVTPFALGGATAWTELMWIEYLVDRYGGPDVFKRISNGEPGAWRDPAVLKSAQTVRDLVDRGAFGTNYASVDYNSHAAETLFAKGKAAMHLMGSWEFTNHMELQPDFARKGLGFAPFPAVDGGTGDPANVVGNPTNFFSVTAKSQHKDAAIQFLKTMMSDTYVQGLLDAGDVPVLGSVEPKLASTPNPEFARFQLDMVRKAPAFTLSWDQALSSAGAQTLHTTIQDLFNGKITPEQFVTNLEQVK
ncbi:ABC transporter substrate-binding protein [Kibdelosporangium aridum]|uniref:Xylobiose transport system substrate-binding protein n=1 Tax=Kibdelosporangium aridum TaxID=2030 RepID=A0A1W2FJJ9_KIBAR|nr:extracellular solute-binding protein [Kibdelosporangium aridum]SMD22111.1 xylobiose transport system substrate-binding protein [Kibdelosporangium aridum]